MIEMDQRRTPKGAGYLLLIGPGAAGKSTLGRELAPLLHRQLVDLDTEFLRRVGSIDAFIRDVGYEGYKIRNSHLAREIVLEVAAPLLLVTSSGFLTPDNPRRALEGNHDLLAAGDSICLLPSRDLERSVSVIVERQLARPFARDRVKEEKTVRDRYQIYAQLGDLIVFSTAAPGEIARAVACQLTAAAHHADKV